jgi:hypothetical protein
MYFVFIAKNPGLLRACVRTLPCVCKWPRECSRRGPCTVGVFWGQNLPGAYGVFLERQRERERERSLLTIK